MCLACIYNFIYNYLIHFLKFILVLKTEINHLFPDIISDTSETCMRNKVHVQTHEKQEVNKKRKRSSE